MPESRIWQLFTQMTLALRYIHKEKVPHAALASRAAAAAASVARLPRPVRYGAARG